MKDPLSITCNCGSGKKLKDCCLFGRNKTANTRILDSNDVPDYTGVSVFYGFRSQLKDVNPFEIDFEAACCQVIQANMYLADTHNTMIQFQMLKPGDWYVMGKENGQMKYSFRFDNEVEAMEVAKEKFKAVRFLQMPEFV